MSKHTPGPWYAVQYAKYWNLQDEPGYANSDLLDGERCVRAAANARLSEASPEMYEAIVSVLNDDAAFTIVDMVYLRRIFEPILAKLEDKKDE